MSHVILRNNLKVLRAKHDLTQEQLADRVEVTRVTMNYVERGKWIPSTVLALKIAHTFAVPVEEVFYLENLEDIKNSSKQ